MTQSIQDGAMNMSDMKKANVCYGCGEEWEHANEYNHLCSMCRYDNNIPDIKLTRIMDGGSE